MSKKPVPPSQSPRSNPDQARDSGAASKGTAKPPPGPRPDAISRLLKGQSLDEVIVDPANPNLIGEKE